jgi:hypothetical protein
MLLAAVDSAHAHAAYSSELRSATALAQLMEQDGRSEDGALTLERALRTISETNNTLDQQDARQLLARLRPGTPEPAVEATRVTGPRVPIRRRVSRRIRRLLRLREPL